MHFCFAELVDLMLCLIKERYSIGNLLKDLLQESIKVYDAELQVTCRILEHCHTLQFFLQLFIDKIHCFLASLRHLVKAKIRLDA